MFMINYQKLKQLKNVDFDHVTIILSLSLYEFKLLFNKWDPTCEIFNFLNEM